jgi:pimeloyl-ACP methyl ester carboxylesterase
MPFVTSADGTRIEYEATGSGTPIILIPGATGTRNHPIWIDLVESLAASHKVYSYDRRGRGQSGDTLPYAIEREIEDIDALIEAAGGGAALYGISSGAVLALDAANAVPGKVSHLIVYEPPFFVNDSHPPLPNTYVADLERAIAGGDRSRAGEIFLTQAIGIPPEYVEGMKADPSWKELEDVAHTISYDGRIMGTTMSGNPLPIDRWNRVTMPTRIITGGNSDPFFQTGADALAGLLPDATRQVIPGQDHSIPGSVLAPVMIEYLAGVPIQQ